MNMISLPPPVPQLSGYTKAFYHLWSSERAYQNYFHAEPHLRGSKILRSNGFTFQMILFISLSELSPLMILSENTHQNSHWLILCALFVTFEAFLHQRWQRKKQNNPGRHSHIQVLEIRFERKKKNNKICISRRRLSFSRSICESFNNTEGYPKTYFHPLEN